MAAGDARVQFIGKQNGYGNVVILDHGRGYSTLYGHMSRFGKIHAGSASAGHRHRLRRHDRPGHRPAPALRIPRQRTAPQSTTVTMPPPEPLHGAELAAFRAQTAPGGKMESGKGDVRRSRTGPPGSGKKAEALHRDKPRTPAPCRRLRS
jgi:hypothetical protein